MANTFLSNHPELEARLQETRARDAASSKLRERIKKERRVLFPTLFVAALAWPNFSTAKVSGHSMEPRFHTGDTLFVLKSYRYFSHLKTGDVVVIHLRHGSIAGEEIVKRVVFIQNAAGNAPWPKVLPTGTGIVPTSDAFPKEAAGFTKTPPGTIMVMGDNYMNSMDSRDFGPVYDSEIDGKVLNP